MNFITNEKNLQYLVMTLISDILISNSNRRQLIND